MPVSPDIATCEACLAEMWDPKDRRHRYPFINCTHCGPRFTISRDIPYDRDTTTMAGFLMCSACRAEYEDPADRRFHAQPIACPDCGPQVWLEEEGHRVADRREAVTRARRLLTEGGIVAVKGLGGFHLACDATSREAVGRLRERKRRDAKPFGLMAASVEVIGRHAEVIDASRRLLESPERPIVLLPWRKGTSIVEGVAPGRDRLGFMLPYTPLHHLLLEPDPSFPEVLVMTSANLSDEPIVYRDEEAHPRLDGIADALLLHDRPIHIRTDDSVVAEFRHRPSFLRRSRGYAPLPIRLPCSAPPGLAVGGELKSVFCLTRGDQAYVSHHIGDLEYLEAYDAFEHAVEHYQRLFRVRPEWIAHDLHPDYRATRYAIERAQREGIPAIAVQHHHAHIASCMADNGLPIDARVIGVALDGTGYGTDATIWGGEFLICTYTSFERALHLEPCPLPGGDAAVQHPYRIALAWLRHAGVEWTEDLPPARAAQADERTLLESQLRAGVNTPLTSSLGRLFDAMASLAGVCQRARYEAHAPCLLEAAGRGARGGGAYRFDLGEGVIDWRPVICGAAEDVRAGVDSSIVSSRFHKGLARMVLDSCRRLRDAISLDTVVLSGGSWQNATLLNEAFVLLEADGFRPLAHHQAPANDGGLSLGQAAIAAFQMGRDPV
jgi:hydrogenase maturation protein HypF